MKNIEKEKNPPHVLDIYIIWFKYTRLLGYTTWCRNVAGLKFTAVPPKKVDSKPKNPPRDFSWNDPKNVHLEGTPRFWCNFQKKLFFVGEYKNMWPWRSSNKKGCCGMCLVYVRDLK